MNSSMLRLLATKVGIKLKQKAIKNKVLNLNPDQRKLSLAVTLTEVELIKE